MSRSLICLLLVLLAPVSHAQTQTPTAKPLHLLTRSNAEATRPALTLEQRQWLSTRTHLVLGTAAADNPPFDVTSSGEYQGLTADYAGLIAQGLGVPVQVLHFTSRQRAVQALKSGQIDLLGSANGYEAADPDITLSRPYAVDQPVLVTREDETRPLDMGLANLRLSMLYHYLPLHEVRALYPQARLKTYASTSEALNAVAFGQADVYLGDTISTHFQLNRGHLPSLRMANFGKHEATGFSFALRREDHILASLVNATLQSQPGSVANSIFKRWGAGSDVLLTDRRLQLTPREKRWLSEHPSMRVVVTDTSAPLSFFDSNGHFRGITADLLELIRLRTGLKFKIQRASGIGEMIEQVETDQADLIAAVTLGDTDTPELRLSRPYLESPYVIVTRSGRPFTSLEQLKGRRVAVTRHTPSAATLATRYPQVRRIETESTFYSLALLSSGAVDATITTLLDANHAIAANTNLVIRASLGTEPASFSMASGKDQTVLASILDKALLSITPEELGVINSRWRGYALHDGGQWREYQRLVIQVVLGIGILLLMALAWNAYLRHQIGQRRQAERALNDQLEFMRALLNGTPHPMYVRDREGMLQSCNDSYLEAVDATAEEVMGKRLQDSLFSNCDYTRQIHADYQQVMAAGTPLIIDRPLRLKDRELTIYHWILPYRDSLGEVQGIIGGWIDISERRELIQDLRLAKQQADDANRAKSTFLATISHEIRTPMNAVIGMLELAVRRADQGQLDKQSIEVAYHSAKDLLGLIGDILDIVRIESGRVSLAPEPVDLAALIESVGRIFEGQAREKGLLLEVCIEPSARCHALLDPLRFKQVLSNLVSNAIKFTEEGHVRIKAAVQAGEQAQLELEVRDSGIGIHEDDLRRLFNPFVQVNPQSENARAGTGLGLAICRTLCEMMGGQLVLKSLQGVGTQVRLQMPLQCVQALPRSFEQAPHVDAPDKRLKVLVIDDHPANLLLMAQQLAYLGLTPQSARDGREGLEKWRRGRFDVLILDCNMPRMNGYQLAETLRSEEQRLGLAPCTILGYTANAQPEVRQRCLDAGMDDCLLKPISLHTLGRHLADVHPMHEPGGSSPLDLMVLDSLIGNGQDNRQRMLSTLQTSLNEDLATLMALDPQQDRPALAEQAHKILGVARVLGAKSLMERCEALEERALPLAQVKLRRQALARQMRRVQRALAGQEGQPAKAP
ncbi:transporter substrate-binding domain-containing protein [Pseudomonas sp. S75]|uniref:ATP-binding protein n=1 Tax=unclassified Pseudomonas TaxID=196821 RepID=UPI0019088A6D|nr:MULTISPECIES: transporter substrate-binding domain-containing protein [unclassified Pseudomonas]MBJ9977237.1 transporter substrate-binding domain-containing protein [Pseudomonas sp. S30]MBK0156184.1 transporter substrate-binding domain-containing protein [Pseudomonas sp. S75]